MTCGIQTSSGIDLDSIFASGSGGAATNFQISTGADLNSRFAPYSSGAQAAATGLQTVDGNDLSVRFQKLGGVTPVTVAVSPPGGTYGQGSLSSAGTVNHSFTAVASNGVGPFSYAWTRTGGTGFTSSGTTTATLTLSRPYSRNQTATYVENWQIVVTDAGNGNTTANTTINVEYDIQGNQ